MTVPLNTDDLNLLYPGLYQLIGGYFHQDWSAEYGGSAQTALTAYMLPADALIERIASEIDALLARSDDAELTEILERLDNNYNYESDGYTARTWLEAIRDCLRVR